MEQRGAEGTAVSALFRGSACQAHRCSSYPGTIWTTVMENMILEIAISQQENVFNWLATAGQSKTPRFSLSFFSLFLLCFSPQHLQYWLPDILGNCWQWRNLLAEKFPKYLKELFRVATFQTEKNLQERKGLKIGFWVSILCGGTITQHRTLSIAQHRTFWGQGSPSPVLLGKVGRRKQAQGLAPFLFPSWKP